MQIDMEHLFAFLGGVTNKLYDDLHDNGLITPSTQEILKGSQWMLLTLLSHSDFNFTLINYIINGLNAINNHEAWKYPYEKALLILYPFLLIISYRTMSSFSIYDGLCILILISVLALEPLIIKEEYSYRKLFMRIFISISTIIGIFIGINFGISNSILKLLIYSLGYALVSSCFQAYLLFIQTSVEEGVGLQPPPHATPEPIEQQEETTEDEEEKEEKEKNE